MKKIRADYNSIHTDDVGFTLQDHFTDIVEEGDEVLVYDYEYEEEGGLCFPGKILSVSDQGLVYFKLTGERVR